VYRGDVWMVQLREGECFLAEPLARRLIRQCACGQDLNSDVTLQALVAGTVNNTHAASPDLFEDTVMREHLPDHLDDPPGIGWMLGVLVD
jgi:hypothetical protein